MNGLLLSVAPIIEVVGILLTGTFGVHGTLCEIPFGRICIDIRFTPGRQKLPIYAVLIASCRQRTHESAQ